MTKILIAAALALGAAGCGSTEPPLRNYCDEYPNGTAPNGETCQYQRSPAAKAAEKKVKERQKISEELTHPGSPLMRLLVKASHHLPPGASTGEIEAQAQREAEGR
jgi:hypothetical protein